MADCPVQDRKLGLPRTEIKGRFLTKYDPALALQVVEKIAEGELLKDICTLDNKMPAKSTFMKWVAREPDLRKAYMAARELSALSMEEEALTTSRELALSPGTAQRVRAAEVMINQLRWSASRRDPKTYGDKAQGALIVPIQINTSLNLGEDGKQNDGEMPDIYTIDITPIPEPEEKSLIQKSTTRKTVLTPRVAKDVYVKDETEKRKNGFRKLSEVEP